VLTLQVKRIKNATASKKAPRRIYPGLRELDTRIREIAATLSYKPPIYNPSKRPPFGVRYRKYLYNVSLEPAASILECILKSDDELSAECRIALRNVLGNARQLAAIVLYRFYDPQLLPHLFDSRTHIVDSYSKFGNILKSSPSDVVQKYPLLKSLWDSIQDDKEEIRQIVKHINDQKYWKDVIIHRVHDDGNFSNNIGKLVVLDPEDLDKYSSDDYYIMKSADSYVVGSTSPHDPIQYHLFVLDACPWSDPQLKYQLSQREGLEFVDEEWFVGAHITNLDKIVQLKAWMERAVPKLRESTKKLREIERSGNKEDKEVRKAGSKMYGTGTIADQGGNLGEVRNFPSKMPEGQKFDLMKENDYVLDGVVAVLHFFDIPIAASDSSRSPKPFFLFSLNIGKMKLTSIMLYHLVSPIGFYLSHTDVSCSGFRDLLIAGFIGLNYAQLLHYDPADKGPTAGLRFTDTLPTAADGAYHLVQPTLWCKGKHGVVCLQRAGCLTVFMASRYVHSSTVNQYERQHPDHPSLGLGCLQKVNALTRADKRTDVLDEMVNMDILDTYRKGT
jgi:hypothetical protein